MVTQPKKFPDLDCLNPFPTNWNHHPGCSHHTWLWKVDSNIAPLNIGLTMAYHQDQNRQAWSTVVRMTTSAG